MFAIWEGGLGIWGGIAGGVAMRAVGAASPPVLARHPPLHGCRRARRCSSPRPSAGSATTSTRSCSASRRRCPGALEISPAHRPPGYLQYATFQPTFLYEIIWNLVLAAFLIWLGQTRRVRPPGVFALYVAGYSGFRIYEETLRIDYSNYVLGLRLNFFVALVLCLPGWPGSWPSSGAGAGWRT